MPEGAAVGVKRLARREYEAVLASLGVGQLHLITRRERAAWRGDQLPANAWSRSTVASTP